MINHSTDKIKIAAAPQIREYVNGTVIYLMPEKVNWLKTSTTGKWIFDQLAGKKHTVDELIDTTSEYYNLPKEVVAEPTTKLVEEFVTNGFACIDGMQKTNTSSMVDIDDLSLQQLWINITSHCNLDCLHCFVPDTKLKGEHISLKLINKLMRQASKLKVQQLVFSGGEPMLHPDLAEMLETAKGKYQFITKLITNGSIRKRELLTKIVHSIDDIQVSIDGVDEKTHDALRGKGSYKKIGEFFEILNEIAPDKVTGISFTPLPDNLSQIPKLYYLALSLGAKYIHLNRPKRPGNLQGEKLLSSKAFLSNQFFEEALDKYNELLQLIYQDKEDSVGVRKIRSVAVDTSFDPASELFKPIKKDRCAAGVLTMCVNQRGECFPCAALCTHSHVNGNIKNENLKDIYGRMRSEMEVCFNVDSDSKCSGCDFRYFCGGGCRAVNEDFTARDHACPFLFQRYDQSFQNLVRPMTANKTADQGENSANEEEPVKESFVQTVC